MVEVDWSGNKDVVDPNPKGPPEITVTYDARPFRQPVTSPRPTFDTKAVKRWLEQNCGKLQKLTEIVVPHLLNQDWLAKIDRHRCREHLDELFKGIPGLQKADLKKLADEVNSAPTPLGPPTFVWLKTAHAKTKLKSLGAKLTLLDTAVACAVHFGGVTPFLRRKVAWFEENLEWMQQLINAVMGLRHNRPYQTDIAWIKHDQHDEIQGSQWLNKLCQTLKSEQFLKFAWDGNIYYEYHVKWVRATLPGLLSAPLDQLREEDAEHVKFLRNLTTRQKAYLDDLIGWLISRHRLAHTYKVTEAFSVGGHHFAPGDDILKTQIQYLHGSAKGLVRVGVKGHEDRAKMEHNLTNSCVDARGLEAPIIVDNGITVRGQTFVKNDYFHKKIDPDKTVAYYGFYHRKLRNQDQWFCLLIDSKTRPKTFARLENWVNRYHGKRRRLVESPYARLCRRLDPDRQ